MCRRLFLRFELRYSLRCLQYAGSVRDWTVDIFAVLHSKIAKITKYFTVCSIFMYYFAEILLEIDSGARKAIVNSGGGSRVSGSAIVTVWVWHWVGLACAC